MESLDSFGEWLRRRRTALGYTRPELAECAGCSVSALRKIEGDERRPSRQLAELLADCLHIVPNERPLFVEAARGVRRVARLRAPDLPQEANRSLAQAAGHDYGERAARPQWNLPAPATVTVGREAELATVAQLLADPACRLLTLVGPGGIGKTRLAIEAACNEWDHFADGVFFASLAAISSPEFMVPALAEALGLGLSSSIDPEEQLLNYLSRGQTLLLLDNLEHLLDGVDLVARLLSRAPALKLLTTSRERLGLRGEWVFEVQGLAVPAEEGAGSPEIYGAVQLFYQRARQARQVFELSPEELPHVVRICRLVGGLPLAIELAATWVPTLSCREIADEIERGLDILASEVRDLPGRHRSMRAVLDHSWQLLAGEERQVLHQLAIFRGGFRREAAQAVAGASLPQLSALVSKSLIRRTAAGRYDLHPLVQQFALGRLTEEPVLERQSRDRHCTYFLDLLRQREQPLKSTAQQETIQELTEEIDNVRLAWTWAIERQQLALLGPALRCFGLLFDIRGWSREGIEQVSSLLQALSASPAEPERQKVLGQALAQQGLFYFRLGEQRRALTLLDESLTVLRPLGEPALLVDALVLGGIIMHLIGEFEGAETMLEEGLASARVSGDQWYAAYALYNQGALAGWHGRQEESYRKMVAGIAMWRALGDPRFIALGLNFTSLLAIQWGWLDEAEGYLEESLALSTQIGDRWGIGTAYRFLGLAALTRGNPAKAQVLIKRSLDIFDGFISGWDVVMSLVFLGQAKTVAGELAAARGCFLESLQLALEAGALPLALDALVGLAHLELAAGQARSALELSSFVAGHPAGYYEARQRAGQLQLQAERHLSPPEVAAIQARVREQSLTAIADQVLASPSDMA